MTLPDFKGYALRRSSSHTISFSLFVAVLGLVVAVVLLAAGKRSPEGSEVWKLVSAVAFATGVLTAAVVYYSTRIRTVIRSEEGKLYVEVADRNLPAPLRVEYPFTARMQHTEHVVPRRGRMKKLYYTLYDNNGHPQLTFCLELGTAHAAPRGSALINSSASALHGQLNTAQHVYYNAKTVAIYNELSARLRFMERTSAVEVQKK